MSYTSFNKKHEELPFSNRVSVNSQMQKKLNKFAKFAKYLPKTDTESESEDSSSDIDDNFKNKIDLNNFCDTDTKEN